MSDEVLAAGAVLWRPGGDGIEVAVVHRPRYDDWTLPKGKLDEGESLLAAARREVLEETGYEGDVGAALGTVRYPVRARSDPREKVVHYWSMRAAGGAFVPDAEVDALRWLATRAAWQLLTYDRDRDVLGRFLALAPQER